MQRMLTEQQDEYYYLTVMNENYAHPDMPEGAADGIIKGMYLLTDAGKPKKGELRVQLMGSGTILREAIAAAELLDKDFGVTADIWSCPSFTELRRDGATSSATTACNPEAKTSASRTSPRCWKAARARRSPRPTTCAPSPTRSASSCRCATPCWAPTASAVRTPAPTCVAIFEVDRYYIAHAAIAALAAEGKMTAKDVARAIKQYKIDGEKPNPIGV